MGWITKFIKWLLDLFPKKRVSEPASQVISKTEVTFTSGEAEIYETLFNFIFYPTIEIGSMMPVEKVSDEFYKDFKTSNAYTYLTNFVKKYGGKYSQEDFAKLRQLLSIKGFYFNDEELKNLIYCEKKEQEYLDFKKTLLAYSPNSFKDFIEIFTKMFDKELTFLKKCKNGLKTEEMEVIFDDNFLSEMLELEEGEEPFINVGDEKEKSYIAFKSAIDRVLNMTTKLHFLKKLLNGNKIELKYNNGKPIDNEGLIKMIMEAKERYELEKFEKSLITEKTYSIDDIDSMGGYEFERFLKTLFEKMGYKVEHTKLSGDQGADLVVSKLGETTVVQAKRSNNKISNRAIQEIVASVGHYKAQKGMVITNSEFTPSAIELAKSNKIELVDREELTKLIKEYL